MSKLNEMNVFGGQSLYYLRYKLITVAEIEVDCDNKPISMDILRPDLFFDRINKLIMSEKEIYTWARNRVRPSSQVGLEKYLDRLNINMNEDNWEWDLLVKTQGCSVKDKLWLSNKAEVNYSDVPQSSLVFNVVDKDLSRHYLNVFSTKSILNVDGACAKDIYRINGELAIIKQPLQHNTYDCVAEEICYFIARDLGVSCAPAGYLGGDRCFSIIDENLDLIHACDILETDNSSLLFCYDKLCRLTECKKTRVDFLRMMAFDLITRQLDRNLTNFAFYRTIDGDITMSRLFDNGLALFSSSRFRPDTEFVSQSGDSRVLRDFIKREIVKYKEPVFYGHLDRDRLIEYFRSYDNYMRNKNGNNYEHIVDWVMNSYSAIIL